MDEGVVKDLAMIARNAIDRIIELEKREWSGLPDMQVFDLADKHLYGGQNYGVLSFYQAIEKALKEKNEYGG